MLKTNTQWPRTLRLRVACLIAVPALLLAFQGGHAATIDTVPVGNAGNGADSNGFGAVADAFQIGKFEVTNAQYVDFLNAVDPTGANALRLFDTNMTTNANGGIGLSAAAANGSKYGIKTGRDDNPVVLVTWYDALRFANWMHNGQGAGDTETGAYALGPLAFDGTPINGASITRSAGARWFLPSEDEWYKAAYHKNDGASGNYWNYPTATDATPFSDEPAGTDAPDPDNTANFYRDDSFSNNYDDGYAVTGTHWIDFDPNQNYLTDVGAYGNSASPYGTFDQAGNVWEWNEALLGDLDRATHGGSWGRGASQTATTAMPNHGLPPDMGYDYVGFRLASGVPEPGTLSLLALGMLAVLLPLRRGREPRC